MISRKRKRKRHLVDDDDEMESSIGGGLLDHMLGNNVSITDNHIYFYTDVNQKSIEQLVRAIRQLNCDLEAISSKYNVKPNIYIHIQSDGGEIYPALAGVDTILKSKIPVITIVEGSAASAATLLSIAGNERYIHKNAFMLIHQLRSAYWGKMDEMEEEMENLKELMTALKNLYAEHTKLTRTKLTNILKQDKFWNAKKCLEVGLVDKII